MWPTAAFAYSFTMPIRQYRSGHTAYRRASLNDLYQISFKLKKLFCGRTDVQTDGRTFSPSNVIRLVEFLT